MGTSYSHCKAEECRPFRGAGSHVLTSYSQKQALPGFAMTAAPGSKCKSPRANDAG